MIKKVIEDAINKQITREMYSSNLYLAMAGYLHSVNLNGMANWMRIQAKEEMDHAMKFFDYLLDRGGTFQLGAMDAPPSEWNSAVDAFEAAYEHEQKVTAWITEIAELAKAEKDHATDILLQWFITEQVEEEATASEIVERLKMADGSKGGIFMMDNELKQRTYTPSASEE